MKPPDISFLIAAFNEEKYLEACVASCLSQTAASVEVCIVDDGSTDSTKDIIWKLSNDPRVKFHIFDKNQGKVCAFNRAYEMATGRYIALVGADDVNELNRASASIERIEETGSNLIYADYWICDELLNVDCLQRCTAEASLEDLAFNNKISGGTMTFDRKVSNSTFPIPECLPFEDWWIAFIAVRDFRTSKLDAPVLFYRHHGNNDSVASREPRGLRKTKDFKRHDVYYEVLINNTLESPPFQRRVRHLLGDSRCFKRMYTATGWKEKLTAFRQNVASNGFPRTKIGWMTIFMLIPYSASAFDFLLQEMQDRRRSSQ